MHTNSTKAFTTEHIYFVFIVALLIFQKKKKIGVAAAVVAVIE